MRSFTKRALSLALAFVLCFGLVSGIGLEASAATVNYVTGNPSSKYQNVIKNWGTRGTTATFLSPNAEQFYEDNNVTYDELALLSGSSNTGSVPSSALYQKLNQLVTENQTKITSYDDTKDLFQYTDCQGNGLASNKISCFYSGSGIGPAWGEGNWNREHTWPNSKGDANGQGENDIMMLRPTSSSINSGRGNKAYGEVASTTYYNPNQDAKGQYDLRGDVARIMLYVYTRWGTENMWGASGVIESKEVLLKWMQEDPVDTWEMGRNDSVESITGTRNVYVDYPELAFCLFNAEVPVMTTPSGEAAGTAVSYTVTAVSSNTAYGTVSVNGKKITATPAVGCYVSGYTVTKGQATVVRNGNVFSVAPASDCTVQINFATRSAGEETVQFLAHNVYFDEYLQIMYAVYVPEGMTVDKIELSDGKRTFEAKLFTDTPTIGGKACVSYVATKGVTIQAIDTVVTAKAYSNGQVVAEDQYSILQYLRKRLYVDNATGEKAILYKNLMNTAEKLQKVLNQGVSTVDTYSYVYVENGDINGFQDMILASGTVLTADMLFAEGNVIWQYKLADSTDAFAVLPEEGLRLSGNNIILMAVEDETTDPTEPSVPVEPTNVNRYYIATKRTSGNYYYMTSSIAAGSTSRYTAVDSGLTTLPKVISEPDTGYVFVLEENTDGTYYIYAEGVGENKYLGWTSGNSGTLVAKDSAKKLTVDIKSDGTYNIHFAASDAERYLALNNNSGNDYFAWYKTGQKQDLTLIPVGSSGGETPTEPTEPEETEPEETTAPTVPEETTAPVIEGYVEKDLSEIKATDKVVITMTTSSGTVYALANNGGTGSAPSAPTVTVVNGRITSDVGEELLWNLEQDGNGIIIYKNGSTTAWLYSTNTNNGTRVGNNTNKYFVLDAASGYLKHVATNRYLGVYLTNPDWRSYTNTTGNTANQTLRFFVLVGE